MLKKPVTSFSVIHKAICKHAGLTEFDHEAVDYEVNAILKALKKKGFVIVKKWE